MSDFYLFGDYSEIYTKKRIEYEQYKKTPLYLNEIKYTNNLVSDFNETILACMLYSTRDYDYFHNSLLMWGGLEIIDSAECIRENIQNGYLNPAKREIRYMMETIIKYVFVDQECKDLPLDKKIDYLNKEVPRSSISPINNIKGLKKEFIDEVNQIYGTLCQYVHPSKTQISEYLGREKRGSSFTFETHKEINPLNKLLFRSFDIFLTLVFIGIGMPTTGDLFIYVFDDKPEWKFHKGKFTQQISRMFDYKVERQNKNKHSS
ncbi:hypothetical protein ABET52_13785 [Saccharococcus caldoxylosilyticus]|uniref:hypothetical protein n=1 Tax=Saccharococcus caldoxylosilyticus TaxID=81408 RepID=UPI003D34F792